MTLRTTGSPGMGPAAVAVAAAVLAHDSSAVIEDGAERVLVTWSKLTLSEIGRAMADFPVRPGQEHRVETARKLLGLAATSPAP
ncbi:MAG: hypothetical protein OXH38_11780 [Chloroflexi bacterium]|nr:hypothetical protein [Chloroflexota bacterium]